MLRLGSLIPSVLSAMVLICISGCGSSSQFHATPFEPIAIDSALCSPITFKKLVFRIPAGSEIGSHHDGLFRIAKYSHRWQSGLVVGSDEFRLIATETMRANGYKLLGGDDLLFGNDESDKAQYQLGGTVTHLTYDTYGPLAGGFSKSWLTIEWQLYDALQKSVVYSKTTSGGAQADESSILAFYGAFRRALSGLMSDSAFVNAVQRSPREAWETQSVEMQPLMLTHCPLKDSLTLPQDLEFVLRCVVLVKAGATVGSGVLISSDGYALTAAHVVNGLNEVAVKFQSGLEFTASVVRADVAQDVALIKLPGSGHTCLNLKQSGKASIGEEVFAVGAPAGEEFAFSVSKGIVSGIRELNGFSYLQTDASLNPGNSGGPLIDVHGNVVAVVSWKIFASGFEGLSFGVPPEAIARRLSIEVE